MATQGELKRVAAEKAVEFIPENRYIGIGTGSTINIFIEVLGKSGRQTKGAVSTSVESSELLAKYGIPEIFLSDVLGLTVYVDGAGKVNHMLQVIKGGGGAHLNERIAASASDEFVCIADRNKYVSRLDKFPLSVEVIPHVRSLMSRKLVVMDGEPKLRVGFATFNGNQIVDVHNLHIGCSAGMEGEVNRIIGVVEDGILGHNAADMLILDTKQDAKVILSGQNWLESDNA